MYEANQLVGNLTDEKKLKWGKMLPRKVIVLVILVNLGLIISYANANTADTQRVDRTRECYVCASVEECARDPRTLHECAADADACVVVFDSNGLVAERACSNGLTAPSVEHCDQHPDRCFDCHADACNFATSLDQFLTCISCDSRTDKNCVWSPQAVTSSRMCFGGCLTALTADDNNAGKFHLLRTCLSDIVVEEHRQACLSGANEKCIACEEADCNTHKIPATRPHCFYCEGDSCEADAVEQECVAYTEGAEEEPCFMLFDEGDIVRMGCASDFDNPQEIVSLVKHKKLLLCEGESCNGYDRIPNALDCAKCDSLDRGDCASGPSASATTKCSVRPFTQCFERVNKAGVTERGCLADLESDEFYDCLTGAEKLCKVCTDDDCNKSIIPADRLKCQICDSTKDTKCHETPQAQSVCALYEKDDVCVSFYANDVTQRNCRSSLKCNEASKACEICQGDGCNTVNVRKRIIDIYGAFQDLPLKCKVCSGEACKATDSPTQTCGADLYQDCVTIFDEQGAVLQRGCEAAVESVHSAHCAEHPELCFNCKSNDCNTVADATTYHTCLACDAAVNRDCLFNPSAIETTRKCVEGCLSALYVRKSNPKVREFMRGCVEDLEVEQRAECTAANGCAACTGDKCNVVVLPEEGRLSCNHCEGSNCNLPVAQPCAAVDVTDQCYMYFDSVTHDAIAMGCKSDISPEELRAEIKNYWLCDGDNCNDYANLPEAIICKVCDSSVDENCAIDPSKVSGATRCQHYPAIDCYTIVTKEGHTKRGCSQELTTEDYITCHDGEESSMCRICTASNCNQNIYPSSRRRCHRCNSADDSGCSSAPDHSSVCPLYDAADECVSKYVDGITYRGCGSELTCDDADPENCVSCKGNNCNTQEFSSFDSDIGPPGYFQELPLNCYHCSGAEECADWGTVAVCAGDIYQTCVTAFDTTGVAVARGCKNAMAATCADSSTTCYECKSNGCNTAASTSDYIDCVFCDAAVDEDCVFNVAAISTRRKCHQSCMTALYARTTDLFPPMELLRSCADDMEMDDRLKCEAGEHADCKSCSTEACNTDALGERKSCYHCSGGDCTKPEQRSCRAIIEHERCLLRYDVSGQIVDMGCSSSYDPTNLMSLVEAKSVWLCDEDNCNLLANVPKPQTCTICSSRTDPACATAPDTVTTTVECGNKTPYPQCYSRILESGHTERGCLENIENQDFLDCLIGEDPSECHACLGDNCNKEVYPADRRTCHVCDSTSSSTCETAPQSSHICLIFSSDEHCVSTVDANGVTVRGCSSQVTCDASSDSSTCQFCATNDCNTANLNRKSDGKPGMWQPLPLSCHQCASEAECAQSTQTVTCSGSEYCMTVFGANGAVSQRGCSDAVEQAMGSYCDANSANCHNCNSNMCNTAVAQDDYVSCIYCDSAKQSDCVRNPDAVGARRMCHQHCMTALYPLAGSSESHGLVRGCLDDKDAADREACKAGEGHCVACSGDSCNKDKLPATRHSCFICENDECEDPSIHECVTYKENDQCFWLYDDQSDLVRLGCVSDLSDKFVSDNANRLLQCEGSNCNSFEHVPTPKLCAACNSLIDPRCATEPEDVGTVLQCTQLPYTGCYTQITSDGSTRRGCISDLSKSDFSTCAHGDSASCSPCNEDRCNIEVYPADRRRCHRCNSKDDPHCESAPDAASVCLVHTGDEFCTTKLVNGHTYRGCSSDFQCDDSDKQFCRQCDSQDNCNVADLASTAIGWPGKWQMPPVNCYTCSGAECLGADLGTVRKCEGNNLQNCVTVFAEDGTVMERGCSDAIYNSANGVYCDLHPEHCQFCKSSGCNDAQQLSDFVDCLFCDGAEDADCIFNVDHIKRVRRCHKACITAMYPRVFETNPAYEFARTCWDDMDLDEREACEKGELATCKACTGPTCNKDDLDVDRRKCFVCSGANCEDPQSEVCTAYREHDQCFTLFDRESNDVERMGCASDLNWSEIEQHKRQLLLCDGDNCNDFDYPSEVMCTVCNSRDDPKCASEPEATDAKTCTTLPYRQCYTHVDKDGVTYRGCLSDANDDLFDTCTADDSQTCEVCSKDNCNAAIYPAGRRSCNRCSSQDDPACASNAIFFKSVCPVYSAGDVCVTKVEGDHLLRGCASDFTCDAGDRDTCRICEADNCNTINLLEAAVGEPGRWQGLPLNCHVCEGEECANGGSVVRKCEGNNLQTCVTVFGEDGAVQRRGCSDDVQESHGVYCDEHADKCVRCKSNGCNDAESLNDFIDCFFCDSATSSACAIDFDTESRRTRKCQTSCMVALYPRSNEANPAYEVSRSCLDDMDLDDRELCAQGDMQHCVACNEPRCNTDNLPALEERHECYVCKGDNCELPDVKKCSAYRANDQCYILFDAQNSLAAMGCVSEYEEDVVVSLTKQKKIMVCDGKNCNGPESIPLPKTCSACNSETDRRCATNPNLIESTVTCDALPYTECVTRVDERGHTVRGCISSLDSDAFYNCLNGEDDLCYKCTGDKCNLIDVFPENRLRCHQCSSDLDPACKSNPSSNNVCPVYQEGDTCVTNLRNGVVTRGCSSTLRCDNENDKRTCRICSNSGCNTVDLEKVGVDGQPGKWQDIPISCHTCKGEADCADGGALRVCENNPYQNCMTVFDADGKVTQRGCSDSVELENDQCADKPENCPRCNSNGCNEATSLDDYVECWACDTDINGNCVSNVADITTTRMCHKHCMTAMYPRYDEENPSYDLTRSCADDMDLDDREACVAGTKEFCKICSTEKCNTDTIPEKRLSCHICSGDECQDPPALTCPTYRPDDKCYVQYDHQRSIVAMGCQSQFSHEDAYWLLREKQLFVCEGDNCNTFDALPTTQFCKLCNSRTDLECATDPSNVLTGIQCTLEPYTHCYERVLPNGATERGCLSSLYDDEFLGCANGTSTTCNSCLGPYCNSQKFPADRLSCHICDSVDDPACENDPNRVSICPLYDAEDTCVTSFLNGVTRRGCSSNVECTGSSKTCVKCTGDACNTVNLAAIADDNYGKWQDLPLSCYSCTGDECQMLDPSQVHTCADNNEQDCVTVFDATSGKVVARGCEDAISSEHDCSEGSCFNCKSNECNSAMDKSEFHDCIYCDSHKDLSCLWDPLSPQHKVRQCAGGCMTALYPSDDFSPPAYDMIRTCLNDKEAADRTTCADGKDPHCSACTTDNCNSEPLPANRLTCYVCTGEECEEPVAKPCPLYKENDKCYIAFDGQNNVDQMGCTSDYRGWSESEIIATKRVYVCEGKDCNTLDKVPMANECAVCDSRNDYKCATNAKEIGTMQHCTALPYTNCYSRVQKSDGATIRGCLADLPTSTFVSCLMGDADCEVCDKDGCNREVFPADRPQCYTCSSLEDENCESDPSATQPCAFLLDSESCRSALDGNVTVRGCKSEIFCDTSDWQTCRSCFGTACNSIDLRNKVDDGIHGMWQELPLSCHTCEGEHCLNSLGPAVQCTLNPKQDCMTVFTEDGKAVKRRGCADHVEDYEDRYCRHHPDRCFKCKSNECNYAWSLDEYIHCHFCNSATDEMCVLNPGNANFATRACYKECMVAMKSPEDVIRTCLDDKELMDQNVCRTTDGGKQCASCDTEKCNNFVFPADRKRCHVCTGSACTASVSQYCYLYDEDDYCFAKLGDASKPELLGCASSQSKSDLEKWEAENKLYRCDDNDCNDIAKLPASAMCLSCDTRTDANCAQNPLLVTATEMCGIPDTRCMATVDAEGHTLRGCFSKLETSVQSKCEADGTCAVCTGDKCNNLIFPTERRKCHICKGSIKEACAEEPTGNPLICPLYTVNDRCVAKRVGDTVERGCASSQLGCDPNDERDCQDCDVDGCNTVYLGGAKALAAASFALTLLIAFATTTMGF